jgi:hypothetical protein
LEEKAKAKELEEKAKAKESVALVIYQNLYQGLFFSSNALAFSSNSLALIFSCSACLAFSSARRFS